MDCLFCKIVANEIPAAIVKKTEVFTAFKDITPQAPTHILIIPNQHYENMAAVATHQNLECPNALQNSSRGWKKHLVITKLGH